MGWKGNWEKIGERQKKQGRNRAARSGKYRQGNKEEIGRKHRKGEGREEWNRNTNKDGRGVTGEGAKNKNKEGKRVTGEGEGIGTRREGL